MLRRIAIKIASIISSMNPVGIPACGSPAPFNLKIPLNEPPGAEACGKVTVAVFVTIEPRPLVIIIVPSVAIKAGSLMTDTISPLASPNRPPINMARITHSGIGSPSFVYSVPEIKEQQIQTVPMDKSIPPVMITNVTPMAIKPI